MLRYAKVDLLQQKVIEFCCSRVVFYNVSVPLPDFNLLFDQNFILNNIKKYKRTGAEETEIVRAVCGKCDGYGFLDWVSVLRTEDGVDEEFLYRPDTKTPIVVKNEDPIETVFVYVRGNDTISIYYVSQIDKDDPLIHRCDQCQGIGLADDPNNFSKTTPEFLTTIQPNPLKRKTKQTLTLFEQLVKYLKTQYNKGVTCLNNLQFKKS